MRVVLLTGPPGAGKTTVLTALMNALEAGEISYAAVEVEALALAHPWPEDDAAFAHVGFVGDSYRRRGYPLLLVSATVVDDEYLRRLLAVLPSDDVLLVRLEAPPNVLRERLARREPPDWVGLPRLLDAAGGLATSMAALPCVDLVLGTVGAGRALEPTGMQNQSPAPSSPNARTSRSTVVHWTWIGRERRTIAADLREFWTGWYDGSITV